MSARIRAHRIPPFATIRADTLSVVARDPYATGVRPYEKPHYASGVTWNGTAITLTIRSTMLANQTRSRMDRPMSFRAVMPDSAQAVIRVYGKIRDVRERP